MRVTNKVRGSVVAGCSNTIIHRLGRVPRGLYIHSGALLCKPCLGLLVAQGPVKIGTPVNSLIPRTPLNCHTPHAYLTPADFLLNGAPGCWDCLDAHLRLGKLCELAPLQPEEGA
jgi:hypothetical protein